MARSVTDTPTLLIDPQQIERQVAALCQQLPGVAIRYAVKVNPHPIVLDAIVRSGHGFEVASLAELEAVLDAGVSPEKVLFAAPVKAPSHISAASVSKVSTFVADSSEELVKLSSFAPGSDILVRVAVSNEGSVFSLTDKFGASHDDAVALLTNASSMGLNPVGLTFHVGSQARDPGIWRDAIKRCSEVIAATDTRGWNRLVLDIGGGFPVPYGETVPSLSRIGESIRRALSDLMPPDLALVAEPGRVLVADAAVIVSSVIGTATRGEDHWVYLDAGAYNALLEMLPGQGSFRFPVQALRRGDPEREWIVAGPSCDSLDRLPGRYLLPADITIGDRVLITRAGAYSLAFASPFCGWARPRVVSAHAECRDASTRP